MKRRQLLALVQTIFGVTLSEVSFAQSAYPSSPVKVLVGFPPGTATDLAVRAVSESMAQGLGQPFVVENRPGAASNIAAKAVTASAQDGYTLFAVTIANTINASFPGSSAVDPHKDFLPLTLIGNVANVLVVHPSVSANNVDELVRLSKSRSQPMTYASSGIGTSPHLSGELFAQMTGARFNHVPYRGSTPAVTDLLGGHVQLMFSPASSVLQHVRSGKLKALAVTTSKRTTIAPELPTLDELGLKGFDTSVWFGLVAPVGLQSDVAGKLRAAAHAALDTPAVQAIYKAHGIDAIKTTQDEFARFLRNESERWSKVIQTAGIKPE